MMKTFYYPHKIAMRQKAYIKTEICNEWGRHVCIKITG